MFLIYSLFCCVWLTHVGKNTQRSHKKKAICQNTTEGRICPYMSITVCICVCYLCTLLQWHVPPSSSLQCWEADPRSEGREQGADKELRWCYLSLTARGRGSGRGGQDSHGPSALPSFLILTNKCLMMPSHIGRVWSQRADNISTLQSRAVLGDCDFPCLPSV